MPKCQDSEFILAVPTPYALLFFLGLKLDTLAHMVKLGLCLFLCIKRIKLTQY